MKLIFLLLICCIFTLSSYAQDNTQAWTADTSNNNDIFDILTSIQIRYPHFLTSNVKFKRSPVAVLKQVAQIERILGSNFAGTVIEPTFRQEIQSVFNGSIEYDLEALEKFRQTLLEDLNIAKKVRLKGFKHDLEMLQPSESLWWLRLSPLLYEDDGKKRKLRDVKRLIETLNANEVSQFYQDFFKEHLRPAIEALPVWRPQLNRLLNQFFPEVQKVSVPKVSRGADKSSRIRMVLEELPPIIAVLRGLVGGDCSAFSAPFFPLVKGARAFLVSEGKNILGYVFITEVRHEGKTLPYIITVNGPHLDVHKVRTLTEFIGKIYNTNQVLVPDFVANPHVVNTENVRSGLSYRNATNVKVDLPSGWGRVSSYQASHNNGYTNYYDETKLQSAKLVDFSEEQDVRPTEFLVTTAKRRVQFQRSINLEGMSVFERAILANSFRESIEDAALEEYLKKRLKLSDEAFRASTLLGKKLEQNVENPITAKDFPLLQRDLGFHIKNLLHLETSYAIASLGGLMELRTSQNAAEFEHVEKVLFVRWKMDLEKSYNLNDLKPEFSIPLFIVINQFSPERGREAFLIFMSFIQKFCEANSRFTPDGPKLAQLLLKIPNLRQLVEQLPLTDKIKSFWRIMGRDLNYSLRENFLNPLLERGIFSRAEVDAGLRLASFPLEGLDYYDERNLQQNVEQEFRAISEHTGFRISDLSLFQLNFAIRYLSHLRAAYGDSTEFQQTEETLFKKAYATLLADFIFIDQKTYEYRDFSLRHTESKPEPRGGVALFLLQSKYFSEGYNLQALNAILTFLDDSKIRSAKYAEQLKLYFNVSSANSNILSAMQENPKYKLSEAQFLIFAEAAVSQRSDNSGFISARVSQDRNNSTPDKWTTLARNFPQMVVAYAEYFPLDQLAGFPRICENIDRTRLSPKKRADLLASIFERQLQDDKISQETIKEIRHEYGEKIFLKLYLKWTNKEQDSYSERSRSFYDRLTTKEEMEISRVLTNLLNTLPSEELVNLALNLKEKLYASKTFMNWLKVTPQLPDAALTAIEKLLTSQFQKDAFEILKAREEIGFKDSLTDTLLLKIAQIHGKLPRAQPNSYYNNQESSERTTLVKAAQRNSSTTALGAFVRDFYYSVNVRSQPGYISPEGPKTCRAFFSK